MKMVLAPKILKEDPYPHAQKAKTTKQLLRAVPILYAAVTPSKKSGKLNTWSFENTHFVSLSAQNPKKTV